MLIYVIAGEASGDALGGRIMQALARSLAPERAEFRGVGGGEMLARGLGQSLFPMTELSVMGLAEIAPKILSLAARIAQTVRDIEAANPDVLLTVDAPDFCFRVARRVRKAMAKPPVMIHCVAPSVWAWRPGRAASVARFLDGMLCLFPFEPPYFRKVGLEAAFIGHPMIETGILSPDPRAFRQARGIPYGAPVLGVMPGSRRGEIERTGGTLFEAAQEIARANPQTHVVLPALPHLAGEIAASFAGPEGRTHVVSAQDHGKWDAMASCDAAMATSGTAGLELAVCGVPHVIGYRMNPLTWEIVRRTVKVKHAHLANIILDRPVVPEFIQGECTAKKLERAVRALLAEPSLRNEQIEAFRSLRRRIVAPGDYAPSEAAARFILSRAGKRAAS